MTYDDPLWEPTSDYDDQMDGLRLGLLEYDDTHCKHGTFTGNWAGPDYMCGYCESGVTDVEWLQWQARDELVLARRRALRPKLPGLIAACNAAVRIDPDSDESKRLFKRLGRYIAWRIQPPFEILDAVHNEVSK